MSERNRIFGFNVKYYLWKQKLDRTEFAKNLGYSLADLWRIEDARVMLDRTEKKEIARALNVPLEEMLEEKTQQEYELAECFECRGHFESMDNKKKILDLFDAYCDIQEMLADLKV